MTKALSQSDYDENYYRSHCGGISYDRSEPHWSRFFGGIAEKIAVSLRPATVFDAGCAKGFLVEELRKRHVEAFGRDYSEYAISEIPDPLKPFCEVGSIADPIEGAYDLVTCIEVLEHMPEDEGRQAIANLCSASATILFSSSPDDFDEPTHLNVQPPIHWLRLFRENGFAPRSNYDPSFLCPWAMLLERREHQATDEELQLYASLIYARMRHARQGEEARQEYDRHLAALHKEYESLRADLLLAQTAIEQLKASTSWRITAPYRWVGHQTQRVRYVTKTVPELARRRGGYRKLFRTAAEIISRDGLRGAVTAWRQVNARQAEAALSAQDYGKWLETYAQLTDEHRQVIRNDIDSWSNHPLISIVMPTYNPDLGWLDEAIRSVANQLYPNWELCIADDCSTKDGVSEFLQARAAADPRIKVSIREVNGHISDASNSAIELATGSWMTLLDQDDLLTEDAIYYVARTINAHPGVELIYSDEDKIENGQRFGAYFKPDWNPDLLRSQNYISHLGVYKLERIKTIGGFRRGFEGAQDHDLVLRFTEDLAAEKIRHIPRVLYHWRSHPESTAQSGGNKSYSTTAGQKALSEHLERTGITGRVEVLPTGMYRTIYTLPAEPPMVSLIIPTRNGLQLIRQCITSILEKTTYPNYEILIIDNNSDDDATLRYFDEIQANSRVRVIRDERPFNYSALNNNAIKLSRGDYVGLINNDIEVISSNWLDEMVGLAIQPTVGAVGARLWYPDDTLQHGGVILGIGGVAGHSHKMLARGAHGYFSRGELTQSLSAVTAACLIIRKSTFELVEGLDEVNLKIAFNDVDFCLKVREAGFRNVWTPYAELYHHESASRGNEDTQAKKDRFKSEVLYMLEKWKDHLTVDPAYNPNLTLTYENFSLAWPPRNSGDPSLAS